jgi:hypothetical protein
MIHTDWWRVISRSVRIALLTLFSVGCGGLDSDEHDLALQAHPRYTERPHYRLPDPARDLAPDWCVEECRARVGGEPIPRDAYCANRGWNYSDCDCTCATGLE